MSRETATTAGMEIDMRAFRVLRPGPAAEGPLEPVDEPAPEPEPDELLVAVLACGVCRTDLHVAEGDLPVHRRGVVPGHEVVGRVERVGAEVSGFAEGDRVGIAWLRRTCGTCRFCRRGAENLCPASRYTGWDADGGYGEYATVPAAYAHRLPAGYTDAELAPLLCAGIIGFHALRRAELPTGGRLGIYGFGGSAHLAAQVALAQGATVHVMTRSLDAQELALVAERPRPRAPPTRRPSRSTPRSCSRRRASWCSRRWRRSTGAGRSRWPAFTSPTSRRWTISATCSRSGRCAASPRTPAPRPGRSWTWPRSTISRSRRCRTRSRRRGRPSPTSRPTGSPEPRSSCPEARPRPSS